MRKTIILTLTLFIFNTYFSQNLTGTVRDNSTGKAIAGANLYFENGNSGTATNAMGQFSILNLNKGKHTLIVSAVGYGRIEKVIQLEGDLVLDLELKEIVLNMPEVVIRSASMTGGLKGIEDIPGSAHYISPKEIQKFSYTDINRTLRAVPGINLQEEDGFGLRPNIGIRGTGLERSSKITVMEDGVLMAPAPYAAPAAYYFPTIGTMQAIEILKGSSQIKYGPYTTGGAINLISTQIPNDFKGHLNLMGGSFNGRNVHAHVGDSFKQFAYLVETFQYSSDGFKELANSESTGFDKKDYRIKLKFNSKADSKIYQSLQFKIGRTNESSNETYLGLTEEDFERNPLYRYAGSSEDLMQTEQSQYSLTHIIQPAKSLSILTTVYRTDFMRNWYKLDAVTDSSGAKTKIGALLENPSEYPLAFELVKGNAEPEDGSLGLKANNRSYYSQGIQTVFAFDFETEKLKHSLDIGFRIHEDQIDRFQWIDDYAMNNGQMQLTHSGIPGTESNRVETANAIAAYVQYELGLGNLTFTPGLRYEDVKIERADYGITDPNRNGTDLSTRQNSISEFIPGIGFTYDLNEVFKIFGGVHKGFAPPGSKEETEAESSINYEIGNRFNHKGLSGQLVLFYNDYSNLLGSDLAAAGGSGSNDLFNGGAALTAGIEFQSTFDLLSHSDKGVRLPLSLVYTYTNAEFKNSFDSEFEGWGTVNEGDQLPYLAEQQFTLMIALEHSNFNFNLSGRYLDEMRTQPGSGEIPENEKTDAAFTFDASAAYFLTKNVSLFLNGMNLSNEIYIVSRRPSGLRPGMPRSFNIGVKANF